MAFTGADGARHAEDGRTSAAGPDSGVRVGTTMGWPEPPLPSPERSESRIQAIQAMDNPPCPVPLFMDVDTAVHVEHDDESSGIP